MEPVHPPFPSASNSLFQVGLGPELGSQTSIFISESPVGLMVAMTRQNAGRSLNPAGPFPLPPAWPNSPTPPSPRGGGGGATNSPAATICAEVMVVSGKISEARLSQEAATKSPAQLNAAIGITNRR